jgi:signal transduction histidine kinase
MLRARFRQLSIAARLFISAAVLSFAILCGAGLVLTAIYRQQAEANFDEQLAVYLRALVSDLATPGDENHGTIEINDPLFDLAQSGWYWQITRLDGDTHEIRGSRSLFAAKLPKLADSGVEAGIGGGRRGYAKGPDERPLRIVERVIDTGDSGIYLVQIAATTEELRAGVETFEFDLLLTFLVLAVALIGSSAFQLRFGLKPLRKLQEGVIAIRQGENEKIEGSFPRDLAPLAGELNLLIENSRDVVERARTQVGNLAHALKTPLTVILNEAEGATAAGGYAEKVKEQAAIMTDQVAYYLKRARAAARAGTLGTATDCVPVIEALLRTFTKIYQDRAIEFSSDLPRAARFLGERQDLEEMIGNLIDNAGKWAKTSVAVRLIFERRGSLDERGFFQLIIDDDGPGLDPPLFEEVIARGKRLDETKPGSGLGLSIVADLASLYGGALRLEESPTGGLRANLRLPAASRSFPGQTETGTGFGNVFNF